jgi:hypothetical protein
MSTRVRAPSVERQRATCPRGPEGHGARVDPFLWRFERALVRVDRTVEAIVVEHATSYWGRPVQRREVGLELDGRERRVSWCIENEPVLEFRFIEQGPATLVVHDFSLFDPLKRALRTRHVHVRYATVADYRAT